MRLGVGAALVEGRLQPGDVEVADGRVTATCLASPNGRGFAVPGFVDLQVNGFAGIDFLEADADGFRRAGEALLETGVTAYLPTFITAPADDLPAALREIHSMAGQARHARPRAARRARPDPHTPRPRDRRLARSLRRHRRGGKRGLRPRRPHRDAPLQRDA